MFFRSKKLEKLDHLKLEAEHRDEIKRRMEVVDEISQQLAAAVSETKEMSNKLTEKIKSEIKKLKIAKKSLTSMTAKLNEGVIMLDHNGIVIHLNRTGCKLFGINEKDVIGKSLPSLIGCGNQALDKFGAEIEKPILQSSFFAKLSKKILKKLSTDKMIDRYNVCNACLVEELPFCVEANQEQSLGVMITLNEENIPMRVNFSVLDNDPDEIDDITYIFLFDRRSTSRSHQPSVERRLIDCSE